MTLKEMKLFETKDSNILDVEVKAYNECGYCTDPRNRIELSVPWETYSEWLYLSNQMGDKEWAGIFTVRDGVITDFKIPKQEVSSTSAEFKEELGGNGIVHSHHGMGAFHSGQDDRHCRNLYDYSIVMSNSKGYVASKRIELPCGAFGYLDVRLVIMSIPAGLDLSRIEEKSEFWRGERDRDSHLQTGLVPDEPDTEVISIEDSPCAGCTTFDCDNCKFAESAYERWQARY